MIYLIILLALLVPSLANATTYWVDDTGGSDANACASVDGAADPGVYRATIAGGVSCLVSGDTLIIKAGTYTVSTGINNTIPAGTSEATRTVVKCESVGSKGARPCVVSGTTWVFRLVGSAKRYITIQGFSMTTGSGGSVIIALNSITSPPSIDYPHYINILDNDIGPCNLYCVYTGHGAGHNIERNYWHDSDEQLLYMLATNSVVRGNEFNHACFGSQGITLQTSGGMSPSDNIFEENIFHDFTQAAASPCYGSNPHDVGGNSRAIEILNPNMTIRRNVCYNMASTCFNMGVEVVSNITIDHNTCYNAGACVTASVNGSTNVIVRNNLGVSNSGTDFSVCGGCGTLTDNATDPDTATNLFVSHTTGDFRLKAGSAAIDGGTDIGQLYNGAAPDHGAFETFAFLSCAVEAATPTVVNITFANNVQPPLLPATGVTGFSAREDAASKTNSSVVRTGDNQIDLTVSAAFSAGTAIDISYSGGNLTDSSLVGNQYNQQYLTTLTNQSCTNNVSGASASVLTQKYFRWHGIYGTEAAPIVKSIGGATDANAYSVPGGKLRLRLKVACTTADCAPLGMVLRYSLNSGSYTAVPDAFTADNIRFYGTGANADVPTSGTATTELLTSDHATNVVGSLVRTANAIPTLDLSQNSETELEYAIELDTDVAVGDTYDFRLYGQDGSTLSAYAVTPRLTVIPMQAGGGM